MSLSPCDLCACTGFAPVWDKGFPHVKVPTVICKKCGLVQINPRPTQETLSEFFAKEWRRLYTGSKIPTPDARKNYKRQALAYFSDLAPHLKPGARLLDVGCATGEFLAVAKAGGYVTTGIEPSPDSAEEASKTCDNVRVGVIEDQSFPDEAFDVICLFHVLYYIESPRQALTIINRCMRPGGILYVEAPDVHQPYWGNLSRFFQIVSIYSYSEPTLSAVLRQGGFVPFWSRHRIEGKFFRILARKEGPPGSVPLEFPAENWQDVISGLKRWRRKWLFWYKWTNIAKTLMGIARRRLHLGGK